MLSLPYLTVTFRQRQNVGPWPDRCGNQCPDFQQHDVEQISSSYKDFLFYYKIGGKILPGKVVVKWHVDADVSRPHETASASQSTSSCSSLPLQSRRSTGKDEVNDSPNIFCHLNL